MGKTYVVEHLDPELGPWSALEYQTIAQECCEAGSQLYLCGIAGHLEIPPDLRQSKGLHIDQRASEIVFANNKTRTCLLDPAAEQELDPEDGNAFDVFLFGGILGDDPPRDRTSELREKGFQGRCLGPKQMTTDTAVRVTRFVIQDQTPLRTISWVDFPVLQINKHESTQMPFRYVKSSDGKPYMPKGMLELIKNDADKNLDDLL